MSCGGTYADETEGGSDGDGKIPYFLHYLFCPATVIISGVKNFFGVMPFGNDLD